MAISDIPIISLISDNSPVYPLPPIPKSNSPVLKQRIQRFEIENVICMSSHKYVCLIESLSRQNLRMKKHLFILCISFLFRLSVAQIDSSDYKDHCLYLYRTEEDFFSHKRNYRGQYLPSEDKKIIKYTTADSKKRTLDLGDSCTFYFAYEIGDEIQIRPDKDPHYFFYYTFGGGTRDYYCVVYGYLPNYDKKGYLLGLTSPAGMTFMDFIDNVNKLYMVQLTEFLKSKPNLLEQYNAEKARTNKVDWERNKLSIGIKYLKLFIGPART